MVLKVTSWLNEIYHMAELQVFRMVQKRVRAAQLPIYYKVCGRDLRITVLSQHLIVQHGLGMRC